MAEIKKVKIYHAEENKIWMAFSKDEGEDIST